MMKMVSTHLLMMKSSSGHPEPSTNATSAIVTIAVYSNAICERESRARREVSCRSSGGVHARAEWIWDTIKRAAVGEGAEAEARERARRACRSVVGCHRSDGRTRRRSGPPAAICEVARWRGGEA